MCGCCCSTGLDICRLLNRELRPSLVLSPSTEPAIPMYGELVALPVCRRANAKRDDTRYPSSVIDRFGDSDASGPNGLKLPV